MTSDVGKTRRIRLNSKSYGKLHRQILQRDGWRCQVCGSMHHLQVHHVQFRSQSGSDIEENLITYALTAMHECIEQLGAPGLAAVANCLLENGALVL